jgi:hypothetical protein
MWLVGHTVAAYLVVKGFWSINNPSGSKVSLTSLPAIPPGLLLLVFMFGNLPDFMHGGRTRILSHNTLAVLIVSLILVWVLIYFKKIDRFSGLLLFLASLTHMAMDLVFSTFYLFYPFSKIEYSVFRFDGPQDLIMEILVVSLFLFLFISSGEWKYSSDLFTRSLVGLDKKDVPLTTRFKKYSLYPLGFILFTIFALLQLWISYIRLFSADLALEWYRPLFVLINSGFVCLFLWVVLESTQDAQKAYYSN